MNETANVSAPGQQGEGSQRGLERSLRRGNLNCPLEEVRAWPGRQQGVPRRRKHEQSVGLLATQGPGRNHAAGEGAGRGAREAGGTPAGGDAQPARLQCVLDAGARGRGRRCSGRQGRQPPRSLFP